MTDVLHDIKRTGAEVEAYKKALGTVELRKETWQAALDATKDVSRKRPMSRDELTAIGKGLLQKAGLSEDHLGYTMVMLHNAFWLEQFFAVPIKRRLLLLPRCLINLPEVIAFAEGLGYRTIVAEGSPVVVKIIGEEEMDAIIGVGCLDSMEKAFDKVMQVGVPSIAIPLATCGCKNTEVDVEFLKWFLSGEGAAAGERTRSYLPLLRVAHRMCQEPELGDLLGELWHLDEETARIAGEWMRLGGKRLRPFITLAGYRAFHPQAALSPCVKRVALAIEAFHKASLVHDDIEDDEEFRYEEQTIHRRYGIPAAINVGDYLLGLGYRLAATVEEEFGPEKAAALFRIFSHAHARLARGQGAELLWRRGRSRRLSLAEVLRHYILKTAPAFEAALATGLVMAGTYDEHKHKETVRVFSKHVGAAFQIQNDLTDWIEDSAHVRPTSLLALALERCGKEEKDRLFEPTDAGAIEGIYLRHDAFHRAEMLRERLRVHALYAAREAKPTALQELLLFLVETIL
ncbi:MAG: polyprenyl synthetase family protein [Planctomycetota bacterium]